MTHLADGVAIVSADIAMVHYLNIKIRRRV